MPVASPPVPHPSPRGRPTIERTDRPPSAAADRFWWILVAILGSAALATHLLALGSLRNSLWGVNALAFFSPAATWGTLIALAALVALILGVRPGPGGAFSPRLPRSRRAGFLLGSAAALAAAAVFWLLRARTTLLGDGIPLTIELARGGSFHPREPLGFLVLRVWHGLVAPRLFSGLPPLAAAQGAVSLASAVVGGLAVPVLYGICREATPDALPLPRRSVWILLGTAVLLTQGYVQLFFGYVETYPAFALAVAVYLWASLRTLNRRSPLIVPLLAAEGAFLVHLSGAVLFPSALVLIAVEIRDRSRRAAAIRDLLLGGAGFLLLLAWAWKAGHGYNLVSRFLTVARWALTRQEEHAPGYLLSPAHWRDFLNEQLLIGPFGLTLFLPLAAAALLRRWRDPRVPFFLVAGGAYAAVSWLAGDSNLGYSRNWDLLAAGGLVFTSGALVVALRLRPPPPRALALFLALSLFHTVPWVLVNASTPRSLARVESLPLGGGRNQVLIATWHWNRGEIEAARDWSMRALEENPRSHPALRNLALIDEARGDLEGAAAALERAIALRPDQPEYRERLAAVRVAQGDSLVATGDPAGAAAMFARAAAADSTSYPAALKLGIALAGRGDLRGALAQFERAGRLGSGPEAWFNLGLTHARLGDRDDAERCLREARARASDPDAAAGIDRALRDLEER